MFVGVGAKNFSARVTFKALTRFGAWFGRRPTCPRYACTSCDILLTLDVPPRGSAEVSGQMPGF